MRWRATLGDVGFHVVVGALTTFFLVVGTWSTVEAVALSVRGVETTAVVRSTEVLDGARAPVVRADVTWSTPAGRSEGSVAGRGHDPGQHIRVLYDPQWPDNVDDALPLARRMLLPSATLGAGILVGGFWSRFRTRERREAL